MWNINEMFLNVAILFILVGVCALNKSYSKDQSGRSFWELIDGYI